MICREKPSIIMKKAADVNFILDFIEFIKLKESLVSDTSLLTLILFVCDSLNISNNVANCFFVKKPDLKIIMKPTKSNTKPVTDKMLQIIKSKVRKLKQ